MLLGVWGLPSGTLAVQFRVEPGIVTNRCDMEKFGHYTFLSERCVALSWQVGAEFW